MAVENAVSYSMDNNLSGPGVQGFAGVNYLAPPSGSQTFSASSLVRK